MVPKSGVEYLHSWKKCLTEDIIYTRSSSCNLFMLYIKMFYSLGIYPKKKSYLDSKYVLLSMPFKVYPLPCFIIFFSRVYPLWSNHTWSYLNFCRGCFSDMISNLWPTIQMLDTMGIVNLIQLLPIDNRRLCLFVSAYHRFRSLITWKFCICNSDSLSIHHILRLLH